MVKAVISAPYRVTTLAALSLMSLIAFETLAIATAMPSAARALDGVAYYGVAFGATIATAVIGMVVAGIWCDRGGLFGPMAAGIAFMVSGLFISGAAGQMTVLIGGRVLQGIGFGLLQVSIYVLVARRYPSALRPAMFAALSTAWAIPAVVGPPIAGLISDHLGWRWVFLGVPLLGVPAILVIVSQARSLGSLVPNGDDPSDGREESVVRLLWAFVAASGAGMLHLGGQSTGAVRAALIIAGLVAVAFAAVRLLPSGATRLQPGIPAVVALRGIAAASFFTTEVYIPLLLIREHGFSPPLAGFILAGGTLSWTAGAWLQSRMSDSGRVSPARRLRLGFTTIAIGIGFALLAAFESSSALFAAIGWSVAGLGMGMAFPTLAVVLFDLSPPERHGRYSAALQLSDALATATAFAVSGAAFAALIAAHSTLAYLAVIGVAVVIAAGGAIASSRIALPGSAGAGAGAAG